MIQFFRMDEDLKRRILRKLPYGMFVMTASSGERATGSTLTWISQCSFRPPLVMLAIQKTSLMHATVQESRALAVHVLAAGQEAIAEVFFKPPSVEKARLGGFRFSPGPETGCPILAELPSWLEARITDSVDRGDHTVFVAEVVGCGATDPDASPLLLSSTRWSYSG